MGISSEANLAPDEAARLLAAAVVDAGDLALSMRKGVRSWKKEENSPVSDADIAADNLLRRRLLALAPSYGWLSEETADRPDRLERRRVWVVDPIDGTRAYLAGQPDWSVSAALVEDGRPLAAALFAPATSELFVAFQGSGTTRNGARVRARSLPAPPRLKASGNKRRIDQLAESGKFEIESVTKIYSLALRFARVATGEIDVAFASAASSDWDLAAADLLVHEAGAVLTDLDGHKLVYNRAEIRHGELIAAANELHAPLLAVLAGEAKARNLTANA